MARWPLVVVVLLAIPCVAEAKFAQSQGFSGRHGVTCLSCHNANPPGLVADARLTLEGLPAAYDVQTSYPLRILVEGGPAENPVPGQPRGGFDLEVDLGSLSAGEGMDGFLRFPTPSEATYTGGGTQMREWRVVWTAPNASTPPEKARFWLAGLAANGNHIMDGPDAAGERGDEAATLNRSVPPSAATIAAWAARPLATPRLEPPAKWGEPGSPAVVHGWVEEGADGAEWRLDDGQWQAAIGAPAFVFTLATPESGDHQLEARAVRGNATSEPASLPFRVADGSARPVSAGGTSPSPSMPLVLSLCLFVVALSRRNLW